MATDPADPRTVAAQERARLNRLTQFMGGPENLSPSSERALVVLEAFERALADLDACRATTAHQAHRAELEALGVAPTQERP